MSAEDSALCARLWAKDPADARGSYPLLPHLLDTAVVVGHLWDSWLRPGLREHVTTLLGLDALTARAAVQLVAGLHDVGKANPWFQFQERDSSLAAEVGVLSQELAAFHLTPSPKLVVDLLRRDRRHPLRRHEYISAHAVAGQWPESRSSFLADHWVAALDGGHHGTWRPALSGVTLDWADMLVTPAWAAQQGALIEVVAGAVGLHPADLQPVNAGSLVASVGIRGCGCRGVTNFWTSSHGPVGVPQRLQHDWTARGALMGAPSAGPPAMVTVIDPKSQSSNWCPRQLHTSAWRR